MTPVQLRALVAHIEANTMWLGSMVTLGMSFVVSGWPAWAFALVAAVLAAAGWGRDRSARRLTAQAEHAEVRVQDDGRGELASITRRHRRGDT